MAPTGSSIRSCSNAFREKYRMKLDKLPMTTALNGLMMATPPVQETKPERTPLRVMPTSGFPRRNQVKAMVHRAPLAPARIELTAIRAMLGLVAERVLPVLNPNQPNQRINTPRATKGILCPEMILTDPSRLRRSRRGPNTSTPASDTQPPTDCTTVEPEKSIIPLRPSQPPPQTPCPTTG